MLWIGRDKSVLVSVPLLEVLLGGGLIAGAGFIEAHQGPPALGVIAVGVIGLGVALARIVMVSRSGDTILRRTALGVTRLACTGATIDLRIRLRVQHVLLVRGAESHVLVTLSATSLRFALRAAERVAAASALPLTVDAAVLEAVAQQAWSRRAAWVILPYVVAGVVLISVLLQHLMSRR